MGIWTARTTVKSEPEQVLEVLTDPDAAARWAPIDFTVDELDGRKLEVGSRALLSGRLAGRRIEFEVDVLDMDGKRLSLRASGPVDMDVEYELGVTPCGTRITARIEVHRGQGIAGRVLSAATDGLLAAGSLDTALAAIAREAEAPLALAA